jgi:hypothetical protein
MPIWLALGETTATQTDLATLSLFGQFDAGLAINNLDAGPFPALRANEFSNRHLVFPSMLFIFLRARWRGALGPINGTGDVGRWRMEPFSAVRSVYWPLCYVVGIRFHCISARCNSEEFSDILDYRELLQTLVGIDGELIQNPVVDHPATRVGLVFG